VIATSASRSAFERSNAVAELDAPDALKPQIGHHDVERLVGEVLG
jgi:hypothetical protein